MTLKRTFKLMAGAIVTLGLAGTASATCTNGLYCSSASANMASSSNYTSVVPFYSSAQNPSTVSMPGLGANEQLVPTSCPVSVDAPAGSSVLGCYNVVRKQRNYVQVVRPIVYVRYPVPVPVPVNFGYFGPGFYGHSYRSYHQSNGGYAYRFGYGHGGGHMGGHMGGHAGGYSAGGCHLPKWSWGNCS